MSLADVKYLPETPAHDPEIEAINDEAFGPGRFVLAAYKIREAGGKILVDKMDVPGVGQLSLFEDLDGRVLGMWKQLKEAAE